MANTALTALGMWLLAIPGIGLLGLFVFICSFIPIAGVFISTAPIAFVALTEYGFLKVHLCHASSCCLLVLSLLSPLLQTCCLASMPCHLVPSMAFLPPCGLQQQMYQAAGLVI